MNTLSPVPSGRATEDAATKKAQLSELAADTLEKLTSASSGSLIETLGLSGEDEVSLQRLLKGLQAEVKASLEELTAITTYDENLERQYKEVVSENAKLHSELEKARNEIRHLRGQLSITQMTSSEAREEKARSQLRVRRRIEHEKLIELQRAQGQLSEEGIHVPTAAERARTVNAKGQYVDHRLRNRHSRSSTYPLLQPLSSVSARKSSPQRGREILPPPLVGCQCSECNSKQSLGALTLGGRALCQGHLTNQLTKSGQQIMLGDKVIVKGERLGCVAYIGKLDFDIFDQIYIGACLDMPVGNSNGVLKGRRYFQSPPNHGVFVKPGDVICVTGRKPITGGTAVPRVREKVPMTILKVSNRKVTGETSNLHTQQSLSSTAPSSRPESTVLRAKAITQTELEDLKQKGPYELAEGNIIEMSERIKALAQKQKSHEQAKDHAVSMETNPATPTKPSTQEISPQPLPPILETPPDRTPPRATTPLERTLLELLSDADLGATGFLKANELKAVLLKLGKLSPERVTDLLTRVGVDIADDAVGLPYHQLLPHLLVPLEQY